MTHFSNIKFSFFLLLLGALLYPMHPPVQADITKTACEARDGRCEETCGETDDTSNGACTDQLGSYCCIAPRSTSTSSTGLILDRNICENNGGSCDSRCWSITGQQKVGICRTGGECCARNDATAQKIRSANITSTIKDPTLRNKALEAIGVTPISSGSSTASNYNYTLLEKIPGVDSTNLNFASYLSAIYKLAIWIVGLCALFMFLVGAFMYMLSAANTSKVGSAKSIMQDALIGLVLALASYLILYVINPDLVNLRLPTVSRGTSTTSTPPPATTPGACSGCSAIPSTVPNKGCGSGPCQLNTALLEKIQRISGVSGWRITESYPPTVAHESSCHQNGTCADINNSGGSTDPATIKRYYDAFRAAGLDVLYESKGCEPYIAAGITNCKSYPTMTNASSFHVK